MSHFPELKEMKDLRRRGFETAKENDMLILFIQDRENSESIPDENEEPTKKVSIVSGSESNTGYRKAGDTIFKVTNK